MNKKSLTLLLKYQLKSRFLPTLLSASMLVLSPIGVQAANTNQAQTNKDATLRSCPNRLCPVVQIMPKGQNFTWIMAKNGFVNITNTTFWIATSDIK